MAYTDIQPNSSAPDLAMEPSVPTPVLDPSLNGGGSQQQPWAIPTPETIGYALTPAPGRIKGRLSEFRSNILLTMNEVGILIDGKAVPTGGGYMLSRFLLGFIITELAMRRQKSVAISWKDVAAIRLQPSKSRVCICYHLPDKPKSFVSLGFKLPDLAIYEHFVRTVRALAPDKVEEGKISARPPIWAIIVLALVGALIGIAVASGGGH